MNLYYLLAYFLLYSLLGWMLEVVYHVLKQGKVINRGFLNGPVCPIYGFGMVAVIAILEPYSSNLALLFIGGIIFATVIELFGGFILYKAFHMRWWDYTNEPFNLGGYICLRFSMAWGVCIVFAIDIIHPIVELNVYLMDGIIGHVLTVIFCIIYAADFIITVLSILNLNKDLKRMNNLARQVRHFSDDLTEKIGEKTFQADAKVQHGRLQASLGRAEARDLMQAEMKKLHKYRALHRWVGYGRLAKAFPNLKHADYNKEFLRMKKSLFGKEQEEA